MWEMQGFAVLFFFPPWWTSQRLPFLSQHTKPWLGFCHNLTFMGLSTSCPYLSFWGGSPQPDLPLRAQFPILRIEQEALVHLGRCSGLLRTSIKFLLWHFLTSFNLRISIFLGPYFVSLLTVQCYCFQWDFWMCLSAGRGAAELDFKWSRTAAFAKLNRLLPCICTSLNNSSCFSSWVEGGYCGFGKW